MNKKIISSLFLLIAVLFTACSGGVSTQDNEIVQEEPVIPEIPFREAPEADTTVYDTVILNARLVNPETNSDIEGINIGILDGRIAAVTQQPITGNQVVNAEGLIAAPGFIDIDSYDPIPFGVRFKITDGVTTNLCMHGGASNARAWYNRWIRTPPLLNFGASNHALLIRVEFGYGAHDVITSDASLRRITERVAQNFRDGALGISISTEYYPGIQTKEMEALSRTAVEFDSAVYYHLRYSTHIGENTGVTGIQEVIDLAELTGVSTHILHISSTGATRQTEEAYGLIERARARGLDITADIYPYDAWASYLASNRFAPGWQERFGLTYSDLQIGNTNIRLNAQTYRENKAINRLVIANGSIPEEEVRIALQKPYVFIASDALLGPSLDFHPRGAGSFARTIGKYARDEGVITLMEAVAKLTIMPAQRLESISDDMKRKGRIEIGADADIVLFDYDTIIDTATNENIGSDSKGIHYVFVNGVMVLDTNGIRRNINPPGRPVFSKHRNPAEPEDYTEYTLTFDENDKGRINAFELFGLEFIDLENAAQILGINYAKEQNGNITFGDARLTAGIPAIVSYGQETHLLREPLIFKGSVFIPLHDLPLLNPGIEFR